jgi:hypothetical protein
MSDIKPVFDAARHCDAMAPTLGLTISCEQRPAVLQFLAIAKTMSEVVFLAPLDDAAFEPAGVFHAGRPDDGDAA